MNDRLLTRLNPLVNFLQSVHARVFSGAVVGVRAVVSDGARVFLVRHSYVPGWYLPGGGVEPGETAPFAMARELDEEAGLRPVGPMALHGVFFNARLARRNHVLVYRVPAWEVIRDFVPNREIVAAGFFPLDALPDGATTATRRRLDEIFAGAPVGDDWG